MRRIFGRALFALILLAPAARAQGSGGGDEAPPRVAQNVIYAELGGNGLIASLNYERMIADRFGVCVGGGIYLVNVGAYPDTHTEIVPLVPLMAHYFIGKKHRLEFGAGIVLQLSATNCEYYLPPVSCTAIKPTFLIGYRYQRSEGGIVFRAGFTPVFYGDGVYPGAGLSVGAAF